MFPEHKYTDEDIQKRYKNFYGDDSMFAAGWIPSLREKLCSLSEFVKEIKQSFSRYYNKTHHRRGTLWGERFMRFKHHFNSKKEKKPKAVKGLSGVYSLKRLSEAV